MKKKQKLLDNEEQFVYLYAMSHALTTPCKVGTNFIVIDQFIKHIDKFEYVYLMFLAESIKEKIRDCSEKDFCIIKWTELLFVLEEEINKRDGKND